MRRGNYVTNIPMNTKIRLLVFSAFVLLQSLPALWAQTTLANALDATNLVWTTGGTGGVGWSSRAGSGLADNTFDGVAAADPQVDAGRVDGTEQLVNAPPVIQSLARQPDGSVELRASGVPGQTYLIQACEKLGAWATISTNVTDANGIIVFVDGNATNYTSRFYRLAAP